MLTQNDMQSLVDDIRQDWQMSANMGISGATVKTMIENFGGYNTVSAITFILSAKSVAFAVLNPKLKAAQKVIKYVSEKGLKLIDSKPEPPVSFTADKVHSFGMDTVQTAAILLKDALTDAVVEVNAEEYFEDRNALKVYLMNQLFKQYYLIETNTGPELHQRRVADKISQDLLMELMQQKRGNFKSLHSKLGMNLFNDINSRALKMAKQYLERYGRGTLCKAYMKRFNSNEVMVIPISKVGSYNELNWNGLFSSGQGIAWRLRVVETRNPTRRYEVVWDDNAGIEIKGMYVPERLTEILRSTNG